MGKNNVLIYTDWLEIIEDLEDTEISTLFQNILRYQANLPLLEMNKITRIAFKPIKQAIDRDNEAYAEKCRKNKENSDKYWKNKNKSNDNERLSTDNERNRTISDNDNDNDNDNDIYNIDYKSIVDLYNRLCPSLSKVKSLSNARKKAIKARLNSYNIDAFEELFKKAEKSDFLKGNNSRNWTATFDWLIKDSNMAKVLDGNYDNRSGTQKMDKPKIKASFQGRNYDFDELEKQIVNK